MTDEETDMLARRIVNIWRSTPSVREWRDRLAPLDYDACVAALAELRDRQEGSLSIAQFVKQYRPPHRSFAAPKRCELCDGTGWRRSGLDLVFGDDAEFNAGTARVQEQIEPCGCSKGAGARLTLEAINADREPLSMPHRFVPADSYPPELAERDRANRARALGGSR